LLLRAADLHTALTVHIIDPTSMPSALLLCQALLIAALPCRALRRFAWFAFAPMPDGAAMCRLSIPLLYAQREQRAAMRAAA